MNCRAILLAASPDNTPIPGVYKDLEAFYFFLRSNLGGAWDAAEILQHSNPKRDEVLSLVNAAKNTDYTLVFFAGRGETAKAGVPWPEARLFLNPRETITERELNSASPYCAFIFDCSLRTSVPNQQKSLMKASAQSDESERSSDFRALYEEGLAAAEGGLVKAYAMAVGEVGAGAISFTQHLLRESIAWATQNRGTLHLGDAVALAGGAMKRESPQQQVEYRGGRRLSDFPFAVQI